MALLFLSYISGFVAHVIFHKISSYNSEGSAACKDKVLVRRNVSQCVDNALHRHISHAIYKVAFCLWKYVFYILIVILSWFSVKLNEKHYHLFSVISYTPAMCSHQYLQCGGAGINNAPPSAFKPHTDSLLHCTGL